MNTHHDEGLEVMLFAHAQGNFLGSCFASIRRAAAYAGAKGLDIAFTAVLQAPTPLTLKMVERNLDADWRIIDLAKAGLDQARNAARLSSRKELAAFVDGDDLWCESWLYAAWMAAKGRLAIWRPEALLTFGNDFRLSPGFSTVFQPLHLSNPGLLLVTDPLPSGFVAPRKLLETYAWPSPDPERGWSAVDRWWNCEVAAGGYEHRAVLSTFHYRRRPDALLNAPRTLALVGEDRIGPTRLAAIQTPPFAHGPRVGFTGSGDEHFA